LIGLLLYLLQAPAGLQDHRFCSCRWHLFFLPAGLPDPRYRTSQWPGVTHLVLAAYMLVVLVYGLWEKSWAFGPAARWGGGMGEGCHVEMCRVG